MSTTNYARYRDRGEFSNSRLGRIRSNYGVLHPSGQAAAAELERRGILSTSTRPTIAIRGYNATPQPASPPPAAPPPAPAAPPAPPKPVSKGPQAAHFGSQFYGSPTCCGTAEFGNFVSNSYLDWNDIEPDQLAIIQNRLYEPGKSQLYSFTVAELGGGQVMAEIILPKLGFECVNTFSNRNGGRTVKTWLWTCDGYKR